MGTTFTDDIPLPISSKSTKLKDRIKVYIRQKGLAYKTEQLYLYWIRIFIRYHQYKHPEIMGGTEVKSFLRFLAIEIQYTKSDLKCTGIFIPLFP